MKEEYTKRFIELADQHMNGTITPSDLVTLQQEIKKEPFLKKVIEQHVQARANIRVAGEQELKASLMNRFEEIPIEKKSSKLWKNILYAILLIAMIAIAFKLGQDFNKKPIIAEMTPPSFDVMRTDGLIVDEKHWTEAIKLFNNKQYQLCLSELGKIKDETFSFNNFGKIQIMKGYCAIQENKQELAFESFEKIKKDNPYYDQSQWYLSTYAYQLNDLEKASVYLEEILKNSQHYKYKDAKRLLDQIKN